jgi:hypothetical protein
VSLQVASCCLLPSAELVLTSLLSEIDKFGFGKYQRCIWLLCGFGYFLDLAWAQGVGLLATAV